MIMFKIFKLWLAIVAIFTVIADAQDFSLVNIDQGNKKKDLLPFINLAPSKLSFMGQASSVKAWGKSFLKPTSISYGPTPADAIAYALADIQTVPALDRPFQRYIWVPDGDPAKIAAIKYSVNLAVSHSSILVYPAVVAEGKLVRWDLRRLVPNDNQYALLHALWEELQFEPYFHIAKSTQDVLPVGAIQQALQISDPPGSIRYKLNGQQFFKDNTNQLFQFINENWVRQQQSLQINRITAYGSHVGLDQATLLQSLTQSSASVIRYDYFLVRTLSTIDGGLYYKFAGIKASPSEGTAQDAFLRSLGADEKLVAKLRSDQRVALFRSNVTGKPRRIDAFYGVAVRPSSGTGLITVTHDMSDNDVDPRSDPIRNLLTINDQAREIIAAKPNGMHIFALFNGSGELQDEVPPNIAKDHTVPAPHTARLQSAISCIRCHGSDGGYKPFQNDVQTMLSGMMDVFGDLSSQQAVPNQLDRLAGLYSGDLAKPIRRARNDYSDTVFKATGGYSIESVSNTVSGIYSNYVYESVDAFKACYELGFLVPPEDASKYLIQLLPPLPSDQLGISPEDPIIGALKSGLKVNRYQWEQVYPDAAFRALQTRKIAQEKINKK
jgi:hypothetical protein